jgi:hypothetical protein
MAWTIDKALDDKNINLISTRIFSEYKFTVGKLTTEITIRTYKEKEHGGYIFEQSHNIKTPAQLSAYHPSRPWGDYEAYAVHLAVTSITQYYEEAIKAGHVPNESWLIPNKYFK